MKNKFPDLISKISRIIFTDIKKYLRKFIHAPVYYLKGSLSIPKGYFINTPDYAVMKKLNNGLNFIFEFLGDRRIHEMYKNIYHPHVVHCLKKYLRKGDTFIDVGANIGYLTMIGAGYVGKSGKVHCFEPVPIYFNFLSKSAKINKEYNFTLNNCAIGDSSGVADIKISSLSNIGWNTMVPVFDIDPDKIKEIIKVKVRRLDDYIFENSLEEVALIKIDVEGFEFNALRGLIRFFKKNKDNLPALIVEVMPSIAYELKDLESFMLKHNYRAYDIITECPINLKQLHTTTDVLFKPIK